MLNEEGSFDHVHLKPGDIGRYVFFFQWDPFRTDLIASFFE